MTRSGRPSSGVPRSVRQNGYVAIVVDSVLSERSLRALAGERVLALGEQNVRHVHGLVVQAGQARASVQVRGVHVVQLSWADGRLDGACTCRRARGGEVCPHVVAVGLAVLDHARSGGAMTGEGESSDPVPAYLASLGADDLRELVIQLAAFSPAGSRHLEGRAAQATGDDSALGAQMAAAVSSAMSSRGFIDYRRSLAVASDAEAVLDEIEAHLDAGAADAMQRPLRKALTRLRSITEQADDSSGVIGSACQRAADLHSRSCREGAPDPRGLARWLVKFRVGSPGWPDITLGDVVSAFDDKAMELYRDLVAAADEGACGEDHWNRFELDQMLLELADHDGDVDRAITLLTAGEHPQFGAIISRLREARRDADAVAWTDRAVASGRVSGGLPGGNGFWLDPQDVADTYLSLGRGDDAIAALRTEFLRRPGASSLHLLVSVAHLLDRAGAERDWAMGQAERLASAPGRSGAALVEIHLADGDVEAARHAGRQFGAGAMWRELADAVASSDPLEAARLHEEDLWPRLTHANTRAYRGIAICLVVIRDLYAAAGAQDAFAALLADLRETHRRRTSLMAALDREGLR